MKSQIIPKIEKIDNSLDIAVTYHSVLYEYKYVSVIMSTGGPAHSVELVPEIYRIPDVPHERPTISKSV